MKIRYSNNYIAKGCNDALGRIKRKKRIKTIFEGDENRSPTKSKR